MVAHDLELGLGSFESHAGLEQRRHAQVVALVGAGRIGLQGNPDIGGRIGMERLGQHPDQRVRLTVQGDWPADEVGITAPPPLPQPMADHRKFRRAWPVFFGGKGPTHGRRRAKDLEKSRRDMNAFHLLRDVAATNVDAGAREIVSRDRREDLVIVLPYHELRNGRRAPHVAISITPAHANQPVGSLERQRLEQQPVHYRKNGGVGADAKRQSRNGDGCESGTLAEYAERVAKVLHQAGHGRLPCSYAGDWDRVPAIFGNARYFLDGWCRPSQAITSWTWLSGGKTG